MTSIVRPSTFIKLARFVTQDRTAVAHAEASSALARDWRRQRQQLAPGARPAGHGQVLTALSNGECWELLRAQEFGRLAYTAQGGVPVIVPVNYAVDGKRLVIRSGRGPKLAAADRHDAVAFEIDAIDTSTRTGWSVVASGRAELIEAGRRRDFDRVPPQPWVAGPRDDVIVVAVSHVAGRLLAAPPGDDETG